MKRRHFTAVLAACAVASLAGALVLDGSTQRLSRLLGAGTAVRFQIERGQWPGGAARSQRGVLLAGDSRLQLLDGPLLSAAFRETNAAIGGTAAAQWRDYLPERGCATRYRIAVLWAGVNDLLHHRAQPVEVAGHVDAVARRLLGCAGRVLVIEQIPVRLRDKPRAHAISEGATEINRLLRARLAGVPNITLVEVAEALRAADGLLAPWCSNDGLHLNAKGQAWLRQRFASLPL